MTGRHETGRHEAGRHEPGPAEAGRHESGRAEPGRAESAPTRPAEVDRSEHGDAQTAFGFRILPVGWMRGLLFTVTVVLTVVIALSELTSAWVLLALPLAVVIAVAYLEALDRITRP